MIKNYFKIAFRNLVKQKGYSIINIIGLAVGMASCLLILLWVQDELRYDKFHSKSERIYRLVDDYTRSGNTLEMAVTSGPMGPTLVREFPEVIDAVRMTNIGVVVNYKPENRIFQESKFSWADPSFFDIFSFPLLEGDAQTTLTDPNSVVISEQMATKYFGDENPVGKSLNIRAQVFDVTIDRDYQVTGVMKDMPKNSYWKMDFVASFITLEEAVQVYIQNWDYHFMYTFLLLKEGVTAEDVNRKLGPFSNRHTEEQVARAINLKLQPITDIHLYSNRVFEAPSSDIGDINNVYIFSAIAVLILFIACINFMNLATAHSGKRAREVGMKKVLGAQRKQLIFQFLGESILANLFALLLAIGLIELFIPTFNQLTQKELSLDILDDGFILTGLIGIALLVGIVAGSYPAFFLSAFQPAKALKTKFTLDSTNARMRKGLIVLQFGISIVLMVGTGIVYDQLNFFRNKKLGFDKEQVVLVDMPVGEQQALKNEMLRHPEIQSVSFSFSAPGGGLIQYGYRPEETPEEDQLLMSTLAMDFDYIDLMKLEMIAGRKFSREFSTDSSAIIINETALTKLGWTSPKQALGRRLVQEGGGIKEVIGVVKDFHFTPLRQSITPLVMDVDPTGYNVMLAKLNSGDIPATLSFIEETYRSMLPEQPYHFEFLDDQLNNQYAAEMRLGKIFSYFAGLAIFIACLGLIGMASFTAEQRTKEIGIRKVHGASIPQIILLLTREFVKLVGIAFLIACPVGYYLMDRWLSDFAYRIGISASTFMLAGLMAMVIALISVSYNAIKAALTNPVNALRYE